jgi:hypothetical protein
VRIGAGRREPGQALASMQSWSQILRFQKRRAIPGPQILIVCRLRINRPK